MSGVDRSLLRDAYKESLMHPETRVDAIIYIKTKPENCIERAARRGRAEEAPGGWELERLINQLDRHYSSWLDAGDYESGGVATAVYHVDGDLSSIKVAEGVRRSVK